MSLRPATAPVMPQSGLERLKNQQAATPEQEKARLKKAAKEFESFFMYQLLQNMRRTIPDSPFADGSLLKGGMGKETFTQMFDMELGKTMATGGKGSISEMLYRSLEKYIDARYSDTKLDQTVSHRNDSHTPAIKLRDSDGKQPVQIERSEPRTLETKPAELPVPELRRPEVRDSIMRDYGDIIEAAAAENRLDSALISSVIRAESNGDPSAVSRSGAKGLMQLMDSTARDLGVGNSFDPVENIRAGSRYLAQMLKRFGDLPTALAAYNAGPGTVEKHGGIPPYRETQQYVDRVTRLFETTRRLAAGDGRRR